MEPNNLYQDLNTNGKKGIFILLSKNKLFIVAIVVVIVVFSVVAFFSTKTPGGFSPFQSSKQSVDQSQQNDSSTSSSIPTVGEKYLQVSGSFNRSTKLFILNSAKIKDGSLLKNPKNKNIGYNVSDLNSSTQIKIGIKYNNQTNNEWYYLDTNSPVDPVAFNLNFSSTNAFTLYVEDAKGNLIKQKTVKVSQ